MPCGSPDGSPMAWQTVLLSIEGQVKRCSREDRRPSGLDRVCVSLNRGRDRGQGALLRGQRLAWVSKGQGSRVLTTGREGQLSGLVSGQ